MLERDLLYNKRWKRKPKIGKLLILLIIFSLLLIVFGQNKSNEEAPVKGNFWFGSEILKINC